MHTRWIETEFDNTVPPFTAAAGAAEAPAERETVVVEVGGKRLEVTLPAGFGAGTAAAAPAARKPARRGGGAQGRPRRSAATRSPARCRAPSSRSRWPTGDTVAEGDLVVVLEAMKMEQPLNAHKAGTVSGLAAEVGAVITAGAPICTIA